MNDARALIDELFAAGEELAPSLREEILARREEAEPLLLAIVADDAHDETSARGHGWAPIHAIDLLGAMGSIAAIPRLLEVARLHDCDEYAHNRAVLALAALGAPALEPCLAAHGASSDSEFREALACVLAELGVRDDRTYAILVEQLERDRMLGAGSLGEYGDARALPLLRRALDEHEPGDGTKVHFSSEPVIELAGAIVSLGGQLTEAQARKLERARADRVGWLATC